MHAPRTTTAPSKMRTNVEGGSPFEGKYACRHCGHGWRAFTRDFYGRTDFVDFFLYADAYGGTDSRFDLDGNGAVDFADFFRFVDAFGS